MSKKTDSNFFIQQAFSKVEVYLSAIVEILCGNEIINTVKAHRPKAAYLLYLTGL
ncbi:MAG: hypothetical protein H7Y86_15220 [Rhizobacter sp.]|nr:hypothetical protein [Ferruginibacter sp.]